MTVNFSELLKFSTFSNTLADCFQLSMFRPASPVCTSAQELNEAEAYPTCPPLQESMRIEARPTREIQHLCILDEWQHYRSDIDTLDDGDRRFAQFIVGSLLTVILRRLRRHDAADVYELASNS